MGTKNNPGAFDCYDNADPDEPMFVLLGRDRNAPEVVRYWADLRAVAEEDPAKLAEARKCAADMEQWRRDHPKTHTLQVVWAGAALDHALAQLIMLRDSWAFEPRATFLQLQTVEVAIDALRLVTGTR